MVKNDIEKMKKEFDEKIQIALLENKLSEPLGDCYLSFLQTKKIASEGTNKLFCLYNGVDSISIDDVKKCMEIYPRTSDIDVNIGNMKYVKLPFKIGSSKTYGDRQGKMDIRYIHNDMEIWITLPIVGDLLNFFHISKRNPVDSESSTYVSLAESKHRGYDVRIDRYDFKAKQVCFYGGYNTLVDSDEINRIIDYIINSNKDNE